MQNRFGNVMLMLDSNIAGGSSTEPITACLAKTFQPIHVETSQKKAFTNLIHFKSSLSAANMVVT